MSHADSAVDFDVFQCSLEGVSLIEASAGTGKTWNICGLYLRLLLERGLSVQQILVVTFTRAATAELKRRIRDRIVEMLACLNAGTAAAQNADPFTGRLFQALQQHGFKQADMRLQLDLALQTFDEAAIFTIHGYCQRALVDTPFASSLPFVLEFSDSDSEICLEATQDFWRRHLAGEQAPEGFGAQLARHKDSPESWAALLMRVSGRPMAALRWPEAVETETLGREALKAIASDVRRAFDEARQCWLSASQGALEHHEAVKSLLEGMAGNLKGNVYKPDAVMLAASGWSTWLSGDSFATTFDVAGHRLELFSSVQMDKSKNKAGRVPQHSFFGAAERLLAGHAAWVDGLEAARIRLLRRFLEEVPPQLRALKRERRRIAFDDILYNLHHALASGLSPQLAGQLQRRYPAALIDEFQDTDPLQFDIFRRIYRDDGRHGTLFLVGDPKQAIYRFRNADLYTYLYARRLTDRRYTLRYNQRSVGGLIQACNHLFQTNPQAFILDQLDYVAVEEGDKPRQPFVDTSDPDGATGAALRLWWAADKSNEAAQENGGLLERSELAARAIQASAAEAARLIQEGVSGRILIGSKPLLPGDIAVLVRTHKQGAQIREALSALGVDSVELSQRSVFFSPEAEALACVLQAIAKPLQKPLLMAALASSLCGRNATALHALAGDEGVLLRLMRRFSGWHDLWIARGVAVMLRQWMTDEGIAAHLLGYSDGERRLTNVLHLIECLHDAAAVHVSPDALLRWLAGRMTPDDVAASAEVAQLRLESDRNLVQIVTVHRAKGLEYAVVFCPFLWDGLPSRNDSGQEGLTYHEAGSGDSGAPRTLIDFRPAARKDEKIEQEMRQEYSAELLRLFYVAITRAVYRCYLVAGCYLRTTGKYASSKESTHSLLNWLVAGGGTAYEQWCKDEIKPEAIEAAWQGLTERAAPHIGLDPLPDTAGQRLVMPQPDADALRVRTLASGLPSGWRIGSFSALSHGGYDSSGTGETWAGYDHDALAQPYDALLSLNTHNLLMLAPEAGVPAPRLEADDILLFPRGPVAGDCLHALFESIDFTDPASFDKGIASALATYPQHRSSQTPERRAHDETHVRMLHRLLDDVLATPLHDGIVLNRVPAARKLVELNFYLPAPDLSANALNAWLRQHGYTVPRLAFATLQGYLRGFIDLVFEHGGRFYLLDWKSNHLGMTAQDYAPARLEEAMQAHSYHLQHLLYSVALHRHLARTLPDYDPERHLGGVLYLFVRGVRPGWLADDGKPCGVFFHTVPAATLASLDKLVSGTSGGTDRHKRGSGH